MNVKKITTKDGQLMLAICDSSLKGKKFIEGDKQLDLSSDFYNGEKMNEEVVLELFKVAYTVNLAGEECISFAIKAGIIEKEHVITIDGIPHAQGVVVREE